MAAARHHFDRWLFNGSADGTKLKTIPNRAPACLASSACIHRERDSLQEWHMQHGAACAERISVRYLRNGCITQYQSQPISHMAGGGCLRRRVPVRRLSSIIARLDTKPCEKRFSDVCATNFSLFSFAVFFSSYQCCWKPFQHQSMWLIGLRLEGLYLHGENFIP